MTGEQIQAVQMFECSDDSAVVVKAIAFLESKPEYQAIEIWNGPRFVTRIPRLPRSKPRLTLVT
jgi:hypothetical protein